jgi:subtilisin family serine protease
VPLLRTSLVALLLIATGCATVDTRSPRQQMAQRVVFTVHVEQPTTHNAYRADASSQAKGSISIQGILRFHKLKEIARWPIKSLGLEAIVAEFGQKRKLDELLVELQTDERVESVQPVSSFKLLSYNDPYFELQNAVKGDDIEHIHQFATGKDIVVGVIDTGIDRQHPELRDRVIYSRNFVDHDQGRFNEDEHGTAVAGVIGSAANNELGIVGVAPDVKMMAFKACWHDAATHHASCDSYSLMKALVDVLDQQPDILNLSLSGPDDPLIRRLLSLANERGIVLIGARDTRRASSFPASMAEVIGVTTPLARPAVSRQLPMSARARGAQELSAPGTDVLTTTPGSTYAFKSGSSMATAYVSGIAALIKERQPTLSGRQIERQLRRTARLIDQLPVVDMCAAVAQGDEMCPDTAVAVLEEL